MGPHDGLDRALFDGAAVGLCVVELDEVGTRLAELPEEERQAGALAHDLVGLRELVTLLRLRAANPRALELVGASSFEEMAERLPELVTLSSAPLFAAIFAAFATGDTDDGRVEASGILSTLDGAERSVTLGLGRGGGGAVLSLSRARSPGASLAAERELEQLRFDLERVFYAVSHDLRAPLRAVENLASWIEEDLKEDRRDEVAAHLRMLRGRVARMDAMLMALLLYAQGTHASEPVTDVDVGALVEELTADEDRPSDFVVAGEGLPTLRTHRDLLAKVLTELVDNAIKHHDAASGRITISASPSDGAWRFVVADDGPGIPSAFRHRVFHIFSTLKRRDEVEGSGIGLAFVRKLVTQRGGQVLIEPREPRGTAVVFTWPDESPHSSG